VDTAQQGKKHEQEQNQALEDLLGRSVAPLNP
jgi:hypothetical protein